MVGREPCAPAYLVLSVPEGLNSHKVGIARPEVQPQRHLPIIQTLNAWLYFTLNFFSISLAASLCTIIVIILSRT
jgi:hypothetical protein